MRHHPKLRKSWEGVTTLPGTGDDMPVGSRQLFGYARPPDFDPDYSDNGLSKFTRDAAHSNYHGPRAEGAERRRIGTSMIGVQEKLLAKMEFKLHVTDDSTQRSKIAKQISIKQKFIEKLRA
jgi:hypothetical protein